MNQAAAEGDRWERHDWWGVVIDCADVAQLTHFYAELRGWKIHHLDDKNGSLDAGEGVAYLNIQHNPDYIHPSWPAKPGEQQMQLHLDFEVRGSRRRDRPRYRPRRHTRRTPAAAERPASCWTQRATPFCLYTS